MISAAEFSVLIRTLICFPLDRHHLLVHKQAFRMITIFPDGRFPSKNWSEKPRAGQLGSHASRCVAKKSP
jgi:hypothetical protein